ncbi:MAG: response regulator [Candidatus Nitrosopolaris sp.]|jgi:DNA-binding response OmpR family regulator
MKGQEEGIVSTIQKRKKILVVDDEADIALTFKLAVEYEGGFDFGTFCEPHLVLSRFKAAYYDMILLDINMPILNGFQLFTQIRKIDEKVKICFIQHLLMCSLVTSREKDLNL